MVDVEEHLLNKYKITAHRNIQWLADTISLRTFNGTNNDEEIYCRYICDRSNLKSNGCCETGRYSVRFSCSGCNQLVGCCAHYEQCVACCLRPDQKKTLLEVLRLTSGHRLRQILASKDQFDLCVSKCRTSSDSVRLENRYKDEGLKYCYKREPSHAYPY
ncbi:unnamed protein product [Dracunculus medinensis]|uniref:SREBP regulating gene protein n=1 Tax=Dracunculus medinensis TaxID=318479 RepID=A0A0N4UEF6_DRAME|nr:unnamed protein product [Dracunculus medinensis]